MLNKINANNVPLRIQRTSRVDIGFFTFRLQALRQFNNIFREVRAISFFRGDRETEGNREGGWVIMQPYPPSRFPSVQTFLSGLSEFLCQFFTFGFQAAVIPEVFLRIRHQHAVQRQQRDQIGNGHQRVHGIGKIPYQRQ